MIVDFK